ncbi:MAG: preprotein translocase subunit SecA [Clostridia bacterium]|nr:preprotein translocase subunit SecA [Clostridia bacterium]
MGLISKLFGDYSEREVKKLLPLQKKVLELEEEYKSLSDEQLKAKTEEFKERYKNGESLDSLLPEAFATCREAGDRVLSMRHFPVQIIGGIVLHQGRISEMKTGEGKTLVATLPAYLNAISGKGVHIVTVNDYLAKRDSEWMGKLYRFLGLSVGLIVHGMSHEEKREAYNADITYCTNNELGFDYLRDNMVIHAEERVQRGYNFAIVDEVDSILIDEARTPLIISGRGEQSTDLYRKTDAFVRKLKKCVVKEMDSKADDEKAAYDGDYVVDEKARTATLTPSGVDKVEAFFGIDNLNDVENMTIAHHVNQAIRAHGVMKRDVNYVVKNGEVIIVDEYTGRLMFGRRYSEGLHQAIEAKEGVKVAEESRTLATITFQNFFRLYSSLSGMTGTATTEREEFEQIYNLDVIEIPTNKPVIREDLDDIIYKTEAVKFNAVINRIKECHAKGQPVLVGTVSIEKSEQLSKLLKMQKIPHNVLNAKHHEKEAEIIAQAGKFGAVTIATNMAGRGTDIMLGGNAEYLAKAELKAKGYSDELIAMATGFAETDDQEVIKARNEYRSFYDSFKAQIAPEAERVRAAGGLCIIGTERHDSRRIDNQLRGRAGRQGDPGTSVFYISLQDDLMRLYGSDRVMAAMDTLKVDENMPMQLGMLSKQIESAQKHREGINFAARKSVLDYDDVMNQQREMIYTQRNKVLDGEDITASVKRMIDDSIERHVAPFINGFEAENWDFDGLRGYFLGWLCDENDFKYSVDELNSLTESDVIEALKEKARQRYSLRENAFGNETMRELERVALLRSVDNCWMDHIDALDQLRQGIGLRAYGQHDPVVAYRNESTDMFNAMNESIKDNTAKFVLAAVIHRTEEIKREKVATEVDTGPVNRTVRGPGPVALNAPCPCGSGLKYKRCCGKNQTM